MRVGIAICYIIRMPLADLILQEITEAGFQLEIRVADSPAGDHFLITARNPATDTACRASGVTLADAAASLAAQLKLHTGEMIPPQAALYIRPPPALDHSDIRASFLVLILTACAVIFVLDLLTPGFNLGIFYLLPLCLAQRARLGNRTLVLLSLIMLVMVCIDQIVGEQRISDLFHPEPASVLNRTFAVFAIIGTMLVMILHDRWQRRLPHPKRVRRSPFSPRPPKSRRFPLAWFSLLLIPAIFALDLFTPVSENLPILYLFPLALVAMTQPNPRWLWALCALLMALVVAGYGGSPQAALLAGDFRLILINRILAAVALVAVTAIFHATGKPLHGVSPSHRAQ